ncbi:MAG: APC family permease [Candidatus Eremiobacteraeota bacterium]|nr:APC family permease [Candidatus Eremiobacteraeota bacterium]
MPVFGVIDKEARGHVVTAILIALVAMAFTAVSYGRMARAYPQGGSAFTYVGRELHAGAGYFVGWAMVLDYVVNPLICTIWSSKAVENFFPALPYPLLVIAFALLFTGLNLRGVETSALINALLAAGLGVVIVAFGIAAVHYVLQLHLAGAALTKPFYDPATWSTRAVFSGTAIAVLTYIGFDGISTLTDEAHEPQRTIPRAIVATCLITGVLAALEVYLAQLAWPAGKPFPDVDTAYVHVSGQVGGALLFGVVNVSLLVATIGSGMASHLGAARLLFAMGRDGALPRKLFGALDPNSRIPANNVLIIGAIVLAGGLAFSYELGAELLNFGALIAFMGVNLAAAVNAWREGRWANWYAIVLALLGLIVCFVIWTYLGTTAKAVGSVWALLGIALYLVRRKATAYTP